MLSNGRDIECGLNEPGALVVVNRSHEIERYFQDLLGKYPWMCGANFTEISAVRAEINRLVFFFVIPCTGIYDLGTAIPLSSY